MSPDRRVHLALPQRQQQLPPWVRALAACPRMKQHPLPRLPPRLLLLAPSPLPLMLRLPEQRQAARVWGRH